MFRRLSCVALMLLLAGTLAASAATSPSSTPVLYGVHAGNPQTLAGGAQKTWAVSVDEGQAFNAIFKGGMWLPDAAGGRLYAKYDHHIVHDNGDWTWVGKVATAHGPQSVVITFGKDAVFGLIPRASGYPLRLVTEQGHTRLLQTDGHELARASALLGLHATQDYKIPARRQSSAKAQSSTRTQVQTDTTSTNPVIDVMVAFTNGFVSEYGSASAALTRINHLVDIANQAYIDSQVHQSIRLVHTIQVSYPDNTSDDTALDDLTGLDSNGNPVPIPASLQQIASLRSQYGADLVNLLRHFDNATDGGCGLAWLIGGGEQTIVPSSDYVYGYSVVADGSDAGFFCLDNTFAHELGHNMGSAHDRAHADKDKNGNPTPGAYSYSFGYLGNGTNGFATIMAYGVDTQTPLDVFSNPNISTCQSTPCGVADTSSSSADNAHSLNNTSSLIAQFEATKIVTTSSKVRNDVDGDGKSDLLFENTGTHQFGYWLMSGTAAIQMTSMPDAGSGYSVVATGDFNGDGKVDIVWTSAANDLYMWTGNGTEFTSRQFGNYPGDWKVVGAGDVDGDGKSDLLFYNASQHIFGYWLLDGTQVLKMQNITPVGAGYWVAATGDFNGNGKLDIVWTSAANDLYMWTGNGSGFTSVRFGSYPAGWKVVGAGDVDSDGKSDLLFYNATTHQFSYRIMNGTTQVRAALIGSVGVGYRVATTGDFNDDGKIDIVWTSAADDLYMWTGNGTGFSSVRFGDYPTGWQVVPGTGP